MKARYVMPLILAAMLVGAGAAHSQQPSLDEVIA